MRLNPSFYPCSKPFSVKKSNLFIPGFFSLIFLFLLPILSFMSARSAVTLDLKGFNLPNQQIAWNKKISKIKTRRIELHSLIQNEIDAMKTKPSESEMRNYVAIVADIFTTTANCMNRSNEQHICRDASALNLVRALKISDDLGSKQMEFKNTPYGFFKNTIAPHMGIKDLKCKLENKKPICKVI